MAHPKSSAKSLRVSIRRRQRAKPIRSALKTYVDKVEHLVAQKDADAIRAAAVEAVSAADKAANKGVIHPNAAARTKSRLMKKVNQAIGA